MSLAWSVRARPLSLPQPLSLSVPPPVSWGRDRDDVFVCVWAEVESTKGHNNNNNTGRQPPPKGHGEGARGERSEEREESHTRPRGLHRVCPLRGDLASMTAPVPSCVLAALSPRSLTAAPSRGRRRRRVCCAVVVALSPWGPKCVVCSPGVEPRVVADTKTALTFGTQVPMWAITGKQCWRCGVLREWIYRSRVLAHTQIPQRMLLAMDSRTVAMKVGTR